MDLGAALIRDVLARAGLDASDLGGVIMGQVVQASTKMNPARQAAIQAGVPIGVPATTVDRVYGSGAQAFVSAAHEVMSGLVTCVLAGGMENMGQTPYLLAGGRWGYRMVDATAYDSMLRDGLNDAFSDRHSGWVTEDLVSRFKVTRKAQDRWASRSQQRFAAAQAAGRFDAEIVPFELNGRKGETVFSRDEHNRPDTTLESLGRAGAGVPQGKQRHRGKWARTEC